MVHAKTRRREDAKTARERQRAELRPNWRKAISICGSPTNLAMAFWLRVDDHRRWAAGLDRCNFEPLWVLRQRMNVMARSWLAAITVTLMLCCVGGRGAELVNLGPRDIGLAVPGLLGQVIFWGQTNGIYGVEVALRGRMALAEEKALAAHDRGMQVWLLQPNGTAIPHDDKPAIVSSTWLGIVHDAVIFTFPRASTNRVAGIVLRYHGKLYCKKIQMAE